jgi:chemotaxis protein methyltransferase CheR
MSRFGGMDFVFCRNVLIYFDKAMRRQVIERLHRSMLPGGFLFVGHSETLSDHLDLFDQVRHGGILQYRKRGETR